MIVIQGRLLIGDDEAEHQLDLPREPPFPPVVVPTPAAALIVSLLPEGANFEALARLFDGWYRSSSALHVSVGDDRGRWIAGQMTCLRQELHIGIQGTRAVLPPLQWRVDEWGNRLPYRDQPTFQKIAKPVHRYMACAERYEWCPCPVEEVTGLVPTRRVMVH